MESADLHPGADHRTPHTTLTYTLANPRLWYIILLILLFACAAESIGALTLPLGVAAITLLPMIWGLLLGLIASSQRIRPMPVAWQNAATAIMGGGGDMALRALIADFRA